MSELVFSLTEAQTQVSIPEILRVDLNSGRPGSILREPVYPMEGGGTTSSDELRLRLRDVIPPSSRTPTGVSLYAALEFVNFQNCLASNPLIYDTPHPGRLTRLMFDEALRSPTRNHDEQLRAAERLPRIHAVYLVPHDSFFPWLKSYFFPPDLPPTTFNK